MSKLILTGLSAAASLCLVACGGYEKNEYNEANATYNADESTYAENTADYNRGDTNDMNATDNMSGNASDNAASNEATTNTGY